MTSLDEFADLLRAQQHLGVASTARADHTIQSTVVNVGVIDHPVSGGRVAAFVTYGKVKLANLRARPQVTLVARSGWSWAALEGEAELIGPDDAYADFDAERRRLLLREIYVAAGGVHEDWEAYDRTMAAERRVAVLVRPRRIYGAG